MATSHPDGDPPRPTGTPDDVVIRWEAPKPVTDPTLGIPALVDPRTAPAEHRLVTIGDSLTHGFQSLAISKTALSWPALVARELGLSGDEFRFPTYDGFGGLPFNLELVGRELQRKFGRLSLLKDPIAAVWLMHWAYEVKHWWTHEADRHWQPGPGLNHNLAVYSYDVATAYLHTLSEIEAAIAAPPPGFLDPVTPANVDRAARRVLANAEPSMSLLGAAQAHGRDGGIETLVVALGANNVLDVVIGLDYTWVTGERTHGSMWSPTFFAEDWQGLVAQVEAVDAEHVIFCTVPHVTVAPLCTGVGERLRPDSRYFEYYTHFWLSQHFDPARDRSYLTGDQARAIDSTVDQYNATIVASVRAARSGVPARDWYVLDIAGILDRLAWRRYLSNPASLPSWWNDPDVGGAYQLPAPLDALTPLPDTRFFEADEHGRTAGGLVALDGVHPTTIMYGIFAREVMRVMERAGVSFGRPGPVDIDFAALLAEDTLVSKPFPALTGDVHLVGWVNEVVDFVDTLWRYGRVG